jgi:APA family basic amino acid/polyamine antiporter
MARDGLFFKPLARLSARTRTPRMAVMFQAFLSTLLVLTGTFEDLTSLFVFGNWLFFALVVAGLIRLRSTEPDLNRPFRVRPYPLVPLLFISLSVVLTVSIFIERPIRSGVGLLVILSGMPVYWWLAKSSAIAPVTGSPPAGSGGSEGVA